MIVDYGKKCSVDYHGKKQNFLANKHMKNFVFFLFNGPIIKEERVEFYHRKDSEFSGAQSKLNLHYMYFDLHKGEK